MKAKLLFLLSLFLIVLSSCKEDPIPDDMAIMPYAKDYYIHDIGEETSNFFYEFAFSNPIDTLTVDNIKTSDDTKLEYEFKRLVYDDTNENIMASDYICYGVRFYLPIKEFKFESFDVLINETYSKSITLDMNVIIAPNETTDSVINPHHIPIWSQFTNKRDFVYRPEEEITINSVKIHNSLNFDVTAEINSLPLTSPRTLPAGEDFYLSVLFNYENPDIINRVYFEIEYEDSNGVGNFYSGICRYGEEAKILAKIVDAKKEV